MENNTFKSVPFGGFDKADVIAYIEKTAREANAAIAEMQKRNAMLTARCEDAEQKVKELEGDLSQCQERCETLERTTKDLSQRSEQLDSSKDEMGGLREEVAKLRAENATLRPDAQSYAQFRERLGSIECEARERAAALERTSLESLYQAVAELRKQHNNFVSMFNSAATTLVMELRNVEANVASLPASMEHVSATLDEVGLEVERIRFGQSE